MKKKLLLADDSITIQKVVGIIFAKEGYELLTASDGDKAFDLALTHQPDLVIADIVMPGKNGFELCRAIKSHPALDTTSVLLLPGAFEEFDETRAMDVCADGWLTKPFESQALINKVTALLEMPPLRLVAAAQAEAVDEVSEETATVEQLVSPGTDLTIEAEEEYFFAGAEADDARTAATNETSDATKPSENELWSAVSFEEEDLKPQELLAASDQDDEEPAALAAEDEDITPPAQALTPEQLAPYVATPLSPAPSQEDHGAPEVEPLSAETDQDVEIVGALTDDEDEAATAETDSAGATLMAEPAPALEFVAEDMIEDASNSKVTTEETDEILELMEEDLEQEEELVEDSATFIDLSAAEEEMADEPPAGADVSLLQEEEIPADDEIFELTEEDVLEEKDVLEEEESRVVASEEMTSVHAPSAEGDDLMEEPLEQILEEDETAEVSFGRRDDDLFADDVETIAAAPDAVDPADSEAETDVEAEIVAEADVEAEIAAEALAEVAPEEVLGSEELEESEEVIEQLDSFEESAFVPPLVPVVTAPSAETLEEQLRQLPEEEIAQIVEKVAGPLIERLAREMLEQVVWEVVPDLAETMISAEIEKIKRGEA